MIINQRCIKVFSFIKSYTNTFGYPPTIREIGIGADISSPSIVDYYLNKLTQIGYINKKRGIRGIIIVDPPPPDLLSIDMEITCPPKELLNKKKYRKFTQSAMDYFKGCAYCGDLNQIEEDHFIPISLGGTNATNNIVPSCRHCNRKKRDKEPVSWVLKNFGPEVLSKIVRYLCLATQKDQP